jgi:hypothetical protein
MNWSWHKASPLAWLRRSVTPGRRKEARRLPARYRRLDLEALEDRTLLSQYVDLGPLRLAADAFQQNGNDYSASGAIQLGYAPTSGETYTPLVDINGSLTVNTADMTLAVSDATVIAATVHGSPDIPLWQATSAFVFDVNSLTAGGVSLPAGAQQLQVSNVSFTPNVLAFVNPDGNSADAQIHLQGNLTINELVGLDVAVAGSNFVAIDHTGVSLTDFSAPVEDSFRVFGLAVDATDLTLAYSGNSGQFAISGGLKFSTSDGGMSEVPASFGPANLPGLVVGSGVVTQLTMSVTDPFTVFGLSLQPGGVTVQYDPAAQQYDGYGSVSVAVPSSFGHSPQATLGDAGNPGLIIGNVGGESQVQQVTMTVNGLFQIFDLPTRADEMTLAYDAANQQYELTGQLTLPGLLFVSATLGGDSGSPAVVIKNGDYQVPGLTIQLTDIYLGAFVLDDLQLQFQQQDAGVGFSVSFAVWLPAGITFSGSAGFDANGVLKSLGGSYSGPGIPVGDTGVTVTGISAEFQNFDHPADVIVSGSLTATYGPDDLEIAGYKVALIQATGSFTASRDMLVLGGNVYFGAYTTPDGNTQGILGQGSGTLTLDWGGGNYRLDANLGWYDDLFSLQATIDVGGGGKDLYIRGQADVNVPSVVPFIGGDTLGGINFALEWHKDRPNSESFAAAWVSVNLIFTSFDIGFEVDFDKHVSVIGNSQVHDIEQMTDQGPQVYHYYGSITIPPAGAPGGVTNATVSVDWPQDQGTQTVSITLPDGTTYDESRFSSTNGLISLVNPAGANTPTSRVVHLEQSKDPFVALTPGVYQLTLTSNYQFNTAPTFTAVVGYTKPTIDQPVVGAGAPSGAAPFAAPVMLTGKVVTSLGPSARVTLFVDRDGSGYHGTPMPGAADLPIQVDSQGNWSLQANWDQTGLLPLPYYLYAVINDGTNTPQYSAYSAPYTPLPPLSGTVSDPYPGHNGAALAGITVYLDLNHNGQFDPATDPSTVTGPTGFYSFYPPQLPVNTPVDVGVVIPTGFLLDPGSRDPVQITYDGEHSAVVNFGLDQLATISGTVYADFTAGRQPQAGWQVYLDANGNGRYDAGEVTALTDASGHYAFYNLDPNNTSISYTVGVVLQNNYYQTAPAPIPPGTHTATVSDKYQLVPNQDFGVLQFSTVSGNVAGHRLIAGYLDPQTVPLPGWVVQLTDGAAIDAGGGAAGNFLADRGFSGEGVAGSTTDPIDTSRVGDPAPQAVYQSYRHGRDFSYAVTGLTPGAAYTVRLHFAEPVYNQNNQRYVNASINGRLVLSDFDIAYVASGEQPTGGKDVAIIESFTADADDTGTLTIRFTAEDGYDDALVNGIEVSRVVAVTTTDANGNYSFGGLHAGTYTVIPYVPFRGVAINAGGGAAGNYQTDQDFFIGTEQAGDGDDGRDLSNSTNQAIDTSHVTDPAPQGVYQTNRYGEDFRYVLTGLTPGAGYTVRLHFAETYWGTSGQRLFNVAINGRQVLSNFDVFNEAGGQYIALVRSFDVTADAGGTITLLFTKADDSYDDAMVSGIEILAKPGISLNAGGAAAGSFQADGDFVGDTFTASTTDQIDTSALDTDAAPEAVYQTARQGQDFSYVINDLAPGAVYRVRLHFAEFQVDTPTARLFNVAINGQQVLQNYDIFMEAGYGYEVANFEEFYVAADAGGTITIHFTAVVDNAQINGIEITAGDWQVSSAPFLTQTVDGSASTGNNFVYNQVGQINGRVFDDVTGDGIDSLGKPGRSGVTVYLDLNGNGQLDPGEPSTVTGPHGYYAFAGLTPGSYQVRYLDATRRPTAAEGGVYEVDLNDPRLTLTGLDFGDAVSIDRVLTVSADAGNGDWTVRLNRGRLEVLDGQLGLVDSEPLDELHSLTIVAADGRPARLTLDLAAGGFFQLPAGVTFVGGASAGDTLRLLLGPGNNVVTVAGPQATIDGLEVNWAGVTSLVIDAGNGDNWLSVSGQPVDGGTVDLIGGTGNDTYALATHDSALRIWDTGGVDTLDFSGATAGVFVDLRLDAGQTQSIGGGDNTLAIYGTIANLTGTPYDDVLIGNGADNIIRGLSGNDVLIAGDGNSVLVGGGGNDTLVAGRGRHVLVAGSGAAVLLGAGRRSAGSILIGGSTAYDANDQALRAILAEWASDRSLQTRIANLTDGSGSTDRRNGDYFLDDQSVYAGAVDVLFGDSRGDWFLPFPGDRVIDVNPRR